MLLISLLLNVREFMSFSSKTKISTRLHIDMPALSRDQMWLNHKGYGTEVAPIKIRSPLAEYLSAPILQDFW